MPIISDGVARWVVETVRQAKAAKSDAFRLLDSAKRAVEITIEKATRLL